MSATEIYESFQWAMAWLAGIGACVALIVGLWLSPFGRFCRETAANIWAHYRRLGAFGQLVVGVCFCGISYYGSTKGFWQPVPHGGGDDILTVTGIYTAVSNEVVEVEGVVTTNHIPMVRVEWLGNGGTAETPVSIRPSETNEWTELEKIDPVVSIEGITNTLQFATVTNFSSFAYWWFGTDLPAIIVTEEGIEIRTFEVTTKRVNIEWVCGETGVEWYTVKRKRHTESEWQPVATVPAVVGGINRWTGQMFTVDTDYDWMIETTITEGDE